MRHFNAPFKANFGRSIKVSLLFLIALLTSLLAKAQDYDRISRRIDSLSRIGLPKSALAEAEVLNKLAKEHHNTAQQLKAVMYRMRFQSLVTENSIVEIVAGLQSDIKQATYPEKPVLQSLLGSIYWSYYQQYRFQMMQRTHMEKPGADFTLWDTQTLINAMDNQFKASLEDATREQGTPIDVLDGALAGDKVNRSLRPTLYDLLLQRALDFYLMDASTLTQPKFPFTLTDPKLFGDSRSFAELKLNTADTAAIMYKGLKYLQQATQYHLQKKDDEALADLDLKRFDMIFQRSAIIDKDKLYLDALQLLISKHAQQAISADAITSLGKYYMNRDSLKMAVGWFDRAVATFPNSSGGKNATGYLGDIHQKTMDLVTEDLNMPDKPLLAELTYRNIKTASVSLYKITAVEYNQLAALPSAGDLYGIRNNLSPSDTILAYLNKKGAMRQETLQLPDPQDYKQHTTEFKIDPLEKGIYVLTVKDASSTDKNLLKLTTFKVTHLAYVTRREPDSRITIRVADRETGKPMQGVHVIMAERDNGIMTDRNGSAVLGTDRTGFSIKLTVPGDTLYQAARYANGGVNIENQRTAHRTVLFTDREIYRPGQTVYFKGIQLDVTGSQTSIATNQRLDVTLKENYSKVLSTLPVTTNDFGSFSGTFIIPQNMLNGGVNISTPNGSRYVRVEEYKRPNFEVKFLPVTGSYKPNDSVTMKGRVTAYSGYGISQARVVINIKRQTTLRDYWFYARYSRVIERNGNNSVILNDTVKTNDLGEFTIKFKASPSEGYVAADMNFNFGISADVTDGAGETRSTGALVPVSNNNIVINADIPLKIVSGDTVQASVKLTNLNNVRQVGQVTMSIYTLQEPGRPFKSRIWSFPDQQMIDSATFKKNFPDMAYHNEGLTERWPIKTKVNTSTVSTDTLTPAKFDWAVLKQQPSGTYKIVINAKNSQGDTTSITRFIKWVNGPSVPEAYADWVTPVTSKATPAGLLQFMAGTGSKGYMLVEKYEGATLQSSEWMEMQPGKQQLITLPYQPNEQDAAVQFLTITNNRVYHYYYSSLPKQAEKLDVKFLTFRNKLQPGEKEQWKLQISGRNQQAKMAEMVAGMYDASLDALSYRTNWPQTLLNPTYNRQYYAWEGYNFVEAQRSFSNYYYRPPFNAQPRNYEKLNMFGYNYFGGHNQGFITYKADTVEYRATAFGQRSIKGDPSIRIDEPVGNSDVNQVFTSVSAQAKSVAFMYDQDNIGVLREITVQPGQAFSKEAIMRSTQEITELVDFNEERISTITPRTNFAETAFFYPQLATNEKGEILIDFTIPESLTKWRFRGFAHDKDAHAGYIETEIVTQKKLSVTANMPRFLRTGDTITISALTVNLTRDQLKGKIQLQLFNALNMQPVNLLINKADAVQNFDLAKLSNKAVSFKIVVPAGIDALTYRLSASAGQYTDGEENTLPILPNQMLVTESLPMMVRPGQTKKYDFDKLINQKSNTLKNKSLTLEYTQNPAWYAVQALPYMMEFPYECSEQLFCRYYANIMGSNLVAKMPVIKQVFDQWKSANSGELLSNLEKNQELKASLIEETPWLRDAQNESEQKKRIALLFDVNKMSYELQANLDKLQKRQLPDGGFPWFSGDRSDSYISMYILAGIGQLQHLNIVDNKNIKLRTITAQALKYLDAYVADADNRARNQPNYQNRNLGQFEIYGYYVRSYFQTPVMKADMKVLLDSYLNLAAKQWVAKSVYEQALIALTMLRYNRVETAQAILKSLNETAQHTDDMGMYWAKNQLGYFWYQSPIETQSLMIELFSEAGNNDKAVEEMKIWLLRNKQTTNWKTTKATASACYALLMNGDNLLADTTRSEIKLGGRLLADIKPDLKADAGTGYLKTSWADEQIKPSMGKAELKNNGKTISWGALHWQYLENLDKITPSQTDIHLERKYYIEKQTDRGPVLTEVDATHQPHIGDLMKVVVTLKAGRDFEYVQLKDMRPSGTEPVDVLSAYKYQGGLSYYQVTKDVATNFFISTLNKGTYLFEYRLRVAQPGNFSTGISTVQSMYAPEFNAHSEGVRMVIKPQ